MRTTCCSILVSLTLFASSIHATEIDSFTDRDPSLKDSKAEINRMMNTYFQSAVTKANKSGSCDQRHLNSALLELLAGDLWSKIENDIDANPKIDRRQSILENSVYQDFTFTDGFALYFADLGALLRVGDNFIGTDKLGHFLQCGYDMYKRLHLEGMSLQEVIDWSKHSESTYYGKMTTGVYSYADLASNYDGLYFWERATNTRLPPGVKPYFECKDKKWWLVSGFQVDDYVSPAWDEAINCNGFKTPEMEAKVITRIAQLEAKRGQTLQCPIAPELCHKMVERYGNVAGHVISPKCF